MIEHHPAHFKKDDRPRSSLAQNVLAFALPFGMLAQVSIVGQLYLLEICFLLLLPFFLIWGTRPRNEVYSLDGIFYLVAALWLFAQAASDIANGSEWADSGRGAARVVFLALSFFCLRRLILSEDQMMAWVLGMGFVNIFSSTLAFGDLATQWKFGAGIGSFQVMCAIALWNRGEKSKEFTAKIGAVCVVTIVLALAFNSRSLALLVLLGLLLYTIGSGASTGSFAKTTLSGVWLFFAALVIVLFAYLGARVYIAAALNGNLGEVAQAKAASQQLLDFDPAFGLLLGGRSEILVSAKAISDAPWLGLGSWAKNPEYIEYYYLLRMQLGVEEGVNPMYSIETTGGLIPTHSHIFGAWVEAGIVGAAFWMIILYWLINTTVVASRLESRLSKLALLLVPGWVWDIFFSPFGGERRVQWASVLVLICFLRAQHAQQRT